MQTIRSNRYRRRRRRDDRTKLFILIGIIAGAVLVAAAIAALIIFLVLRAPSDNSSNESTASSEAVSETVSETSKPSDDTIAVNPNAATAKTTGKLAYQSLYPDMYVPIVDKIAAKDGDKVVYLTFDAGPSDQTDDLLAALKDAGVKATFFVTCNGDLDSTAKKQLKAIADAGHTIGIYSYSNDRTKIYKSVKAYLSDFSKMNDAIYEATGVKPTVFRFPGGSYCEDNQNISEALVAEMERRGYTYYDWNVDAGDSLTDATADEIYTAAVEGIESHNKSIVLMHNTDNNKNTTSQIESIIKKAQKDGYHFKALDPSVKAFSFSEQE